MCGFFSLLPFLFGFHADRITDRMNLSQRNTLPWRMERLKEESRGLCWSIAVYGGLRQKLLLEKVEKNK